MTDANVFSQVCNAFTARVGEAIDATANSITILIGPPGDAARSLRADPSQHVLNFFFYRLAPFEFDVDVPSDEVFRLRIQCMITPFGQALESEMPSEHELRILGDVLRALHEEQSMPLGPFDSETVHLQIVLQRPTTEELNHIWSTQEGATFRSSLAYEIALVPVVPELTPINPPLVGSTGASSEANTNGSRAQPGSFAGLHDDPTVTRSVVDTAEPDWSPVACFVKDGECSQVVRVAAGSGDATSFKYMVWVTGEAGVAITLRWRTWTRVNGWSDEPATVAATAVGPVLDPNEIPSDGQLEAVSLPASIQNTAGQATLVAERDYELESERGFDGSPGPTRTSRSNLLLVVVNP